MITYVISFTAAVLFALILTPGAIILARRWGILDHPGERRIHSIPIPRLGGAAIYLSFWLAVFINGHFNRTILGFFLGSTIIFIVGLADDIKDIRPLYKLIWQIIAAVIPFFFGLPVVEKITLPFLNQVNLGYFGYAFILFWIVGLVNTVNISDGLDGLAGGICTIAALILFWSANRIGNEQASYLMLALAGAAFGFLFYNFHPAKIFMGDSGSMFLGYIIGAVSVWGLLKTATLFGLVVPILVLGMPLTDLVFAVIRRSWKRLSIARADRGHLHHRLLDSGLTQRQAVLILYAISFCFGLAAVFCDYDNWFMAILLVIINFVLILQIMFRRFRWHKALARGDSK
ncbi:MAG: putative undecaprenyl-phosphate N-acetylglucosaminyl 1-phosphate transferase [Candidatus Dichloromethanomonas elyunquensis]|nr:MAG: putative undecaprenyl-phosphate N-acetylglucosaminyl 1-phosphate transferase [Candidatus Dichloromethanomonas elyunquensis]